MNTQNSKMAFWGRVELVSGGHPATWATQIGMNASTVTQWRDAPRMPFKATLRKLADATGIPVEWWEHGTGEIPPDAARRFGLGPGKPPDLSPGPRALAAPVGQPAPGTQGPPLGLFRAAASQRHEYFLPIFTSFIHAWVNGHLDQWLPDGLTLEQAALLVNETADLYGRNVRHPPTGAAQEGAELALVRALLHQAWRALSQQAQPTPTAPGPTDWDFLGRS